MSLTREQVKREYFQKHDKLMSEKNLDSFMRLVKAFDCEDAESYQDAHEKIVASLELCADDMQHFAQLCSRVREVKDSD